MLKIKNVCPCVNVKTQLYWQVYRQQIVQEINMESAAKIQYQSDCNCGIDFVHMTELFNVFVTGGL